RYLSSHSFFLYCHAAHTALHSFPTRRSSDLPISTATRIAPPTSCALRSVSFPDGPTTPRCATRRPRARRRSAGPRTPFACSSRRSEEHTSELQSLTNLVCRLLL